MRCAETLTDSGKGMWGDHPAEYALSTIRRTFPRRGGPGERTTEAFRFSYRLKNGHASYREFPTSVDRDHFVDQSISGRTAASVDKGLLVGCEERWLGLVNDRLSGVVFVADYLQLQFDLGTTNFYAWPTVRIADRAIALGEPGYRDALCSLIDQHVTGVDTFLDDGFVVAFDAGELVIGPDQIREAPWPEVVEGHGGAISWAQPPFDRRVTFGDAD